MCSYGVAFFLVIFWSLGWPYPITEAPCDLTRCTCFGKVSVCISLTTGAPAVDIASKGARGTAMAAHITVPTASPETSTDPAFSQSSAWPSRFIMGADVTSDLPVVVESISDSSPLGLQ
ncbi:uncharacterized protein [Watersipora subatra]|uniref:uncharacterized protein isoform X2 n=1 Tax=Watersipora subatra TaxID=2589382 RepID=UPI00355B4D2E